MEALLYIYVDIFIFVCVQDERIPKSCCSENKNAALSVLLTVVSLHRWTGMTIHLPAQTIGKLLHTMLVKALIPAIALPRLRTSG